MTVSDSPPEILGPVDHLKPLAGLEHVSVIPRDLVILATPPKPNGTGDDDFDMSWQDLCDIIAQNNLAALGRRPADLRNYLRWKHYIDNTRLRGGVLEFLVTERLHWALNDDEVSNVDSKSGRIAVVPPANPRFMACVKDDLKILRNDFPYAMKPGIYHVVVWVKTKIPVAQTGDLTPESRSLINRYVTATFVNNKALELESKNSVLWFKNWAALQSVPSLEHFHVLLLNPNSVELENLYNTGGVQIDLEL